MHFLYAPAAFGEWGRNFDGLRPLVDATRAANGLPPLTDRGILVQMWGQCPLVIVATARAFDEPLDQLPENARYVGPIPLHSTQEWTWDLPWPQDDPAPLVNVSLSTTRQDQQETLQRIIHALADVDAHVLVTCGPGVDGAALKLPANAVAREFVPHAAILPHLALMVTHAGHGTAINSLAAGVPLVCLPMGRDQGLVAGRVAASGAGVAIASDASTDKIRAAVKMVLSESSYRDNAKRMATLIAQEIAASDISGDLEQLLPA